MVLGCSATQLYLESSLSTAMLLSLAGVGSVFMKQWYSCIEDTNTTMKSTLEGFQISNNYMLYYEHPLSLVIYSRSTISF